MKADMDAHGKILLSPETSLEAYALNKWANSAIINIDDVARNEQSYIRGSMLVISADIKTGD